MNPFDAMRRLLKVKETEEENDQDFTIGVALNDAKSQAAMIVTLNNGDQHVMPLPSIALDGLIAALMQAKKMINDRDA